MSLGRRTVLNYWLCESGFVLRDFGILCVKFGPAFLHNVLNKLIMLRLVPKFVCLFHPCGIFFLFPALCALKLLSLTFTFTLAFAFVLLYSHVIPLTWNLSIVLDLRCKSYSSTLLGPLLVAVGNFDF